MIPTKEINEIKLGLNILSEFLFKINKKVNNHVIDNNCIICYELIDECIRFPLICNCKINVCTSCIKRIKECPTCKGLLNF